MPASEFAYLTLIDPPTNFGPFTAAARASLPVQDQWLRQNNSPTATTTTTGGAQDRGGAFFQDVEDPTQILITSHWASKDEHETWIASAENAAVFGTIIGFLDLPRTTLFHVADAELFPARLIEDCATTDESSSSGGGETKHVLSVRCFVVAEDKKEDFEAAFESALKVEGERGGWRIEKDPEQPEATAQYVAVSLTKQQAAKTETSSAAEGLVLNVSTKHYRRAC